MVSVMGKNWRMMNSRPLIPLVLIIALAAAVTGCGGGSGNKSGSGNTSSGGTTKEPAMTKQQFAAKITAICAKGNRKIAKIGFVLGSYGSAANVGGAAAEVEGDEIEKFKSLRPPDEIKTQVEAFILKTETAHDKLRALVHAAVNFDGKGVADLTPEVSAARQEAHNAAKSFGATC